MSEFLVTRSAGGVAAKGEGGRMEKRFSTAGLWSMAMALGAGLVLLMGMGMAWASGDERLAHNMALTLGGAVVFTGVAIAATDRVVRALGRLELNVDSNGVRIGWLIKQEAARGRAAATTIGIHPRVYASYAAAMTTSEPPVPVDEPGVTRLPGQDTLRAARGYARRFIRSVEDNPGDTSGL